MQRYLSRSAPFIALLLLLAACTPRPTRVPVKDKDESSTIIESDALPSTPDDLTTPSDAQVSPVIEMPLNEAIIPEETRFNSTACPAFKGMQQSGNKAILEVSPIGGVLPVGIEKIMSDCTLMGRVKNVPGGHFVRVDFASNSNLSIKSNLSNRGSVGFSAQYVTAAFELQETFAEIGSHPLAAFIGPYTANEIQVRRLGAPEKSNLPSPCPTASYTAVFQFDIHVEASTGIPPAQAQQPFEAYITQLPDIEVSFVKCVQ